MIHHLSIFYDNDNYNVRTNRKGIHRNMSNLLDQQTTKRHFETQNAKTEKQHTPISDILFGFEFAFY
jgi:hypothetical protein